MRWSFLLDLANLSAIGNVKLQQDWQTSVKIERANIVINDQNLNYQLKNFNVYATNLLLSEAPKKKKGYSFSYGKMGFSFHSFDNYLPGNEYRLMISEGSYSTINELFQLKNILLLPQDTTFSKSKSIMRFASPLFTVSKLDYEEVKEEKNISFNNLSLESPNIEIKEKSGNQYSFKLADFDIDDFKWNKNLLSIGDIVLSSPMIDAYTIAEEKEKKKEDKH